MGNNERKFNGKIRRTVPECARPGAQQFPTNQGYWKFQHVGMR